VNSITAADNISKKKIIVNRLEEKYSNDTHKNKFIIVNKKSKVVWL